MIVFGEDAAKVPVLFILSIAIEKIPLPKLNLDRRGLLLFGLDRLNDRRK